MRYEVVSMCLLSDSEVSVEYHDLLEDVNVTSVFTLVHVDGSIRVAGESPEILAVHPMGTAAQVRAVARAVAAFYEVACPTRQDGVPFSSFGSG